MLSPENKAIWTKALRSGEFKQAHEELHNGTFEDINKATAFCCIGVGAKVLCPGFNSRNTDRAINEIGIDEDKGWKLASLNDFHHLTFPEIADIIDADPSI